MEIDVQQQNVSMSTTDKEEFMSETDLNLQQDIFKKSNINVEDILAETYVEEALALFVKLKELVEKQADVIEELLLEKIRIRFTDAVKSIDTRINSKLKQQYKMAYGRIIILFTNYLAILMTSNLHLSPLKLYTTKKISEGMLTTDISEFIYSIISDSTKLSRVNFAKEFEKLSNDPKSKIAEIMREYDNDELAITAIKTPYVMKKLFIDIANELINSKDMIYKIESVSWRLIMSSYEDPNGPLVRSSLIVYAILDIKGLYTHFEDIVLSPQVKHDIPTKMHIIKHILGLDIIKAYYIYSHIDFGEYEKYAKNWK